MVLILEYQLVIKIITCIAFVNSEFMNFGSQKLCVLFKLECSVLLLYCVICKVVVSSGNVLLYASSLVNENYNV